MPRMFSWCRTRRRAITGASSRRLRRPISCGSSRTAAGACSRRSGGSAASALDKPPVRADGQDGLAQPHVPLARGEDSVAGARPIGWPLPWSSTSRVARWRGPDRRNQLAPAPSLRRSGLEQLWTHGGDTTRQEHDGVPRDRGTQSHRRRRSGTGALPPEDSSGHGPTRAALRCTRRVVRLPCITHDAVARPTRTPSGVCNSNGEGDPQEDQSPGGTRRSGPGGACHGADPVRPRPTLVVGGAGTGLALPAR